jgi:beta-N-acetylhexosaminidase
VDTLHWTRERAAAAAALLLAALAIAGLAMSYAAGTGGPGASPGSRAGGATHRPPAPAGGATHRPPAPAQHSAPAAPASRIAGRPPARGAITLSLAQLAGQRVVYAYSGYAPPASLLSVIRAGEAGGVILFAPNIAGRTQLRQAINSMQRAALASPLHQRLLILADQEGGQVRRLPGPPLLSQKQIGQSSNALGLAAQAGRGAGHNLAGVGVNVNLAPVLDVYRQPGNFIDQYLRSYSSNPLTVARLGPAFIGALERTGVAATAKHFPGLGAASSSENTDAGPVTLNIPLATLRSVDEFPFQAAIAGGVKLVMLSWATYPALDPTRPAGLSPLVIGGELRGRLGFRGVTVSDSIDAGAISGYGSLGARALQAAQAGDDLILAVTTNPYDNSPQQGIAVLHALTSALAAHQVGLRAAQRAAARILALQSQP